MIASIKMMRETKMTEKKKILFVSHCDEPAYCCGRIDSHIGIDYLWVVKALSQKYDMHTFHDLGISHLQGQFPLSEHYLFLKKIFDGLACGKYDYGALITNPCREHDLEHPKVKHSNEEFFAGKYASFLRMSRRLKTARPDFPIIAYSTTIDFMWVIAQKMFHDAGVDLLIRRRDNLRENIKNVKGGLSSLLNRQKINLGGLAR